MDSQEIRYTRHAKNRLRWHRISEHEVAICLSEPEWLEESVAGRINAWRKVGEKFLRVTYRGDAEKLVITAVLKKKGPGG